MGRKRWKRGGSLEADILRWKSARGGTDRDGNLIGKPSPLVTAEILDGICQRYSCLPSQVLQEDVSLIKNIQIAELGKIEEKDGQ